MEKITDRQLPMKLFWREWQKQRRIKYTLPSQRVALLSRGIDDMAVRFSRCCNPVPGDEIVGFVTRGRGLSIHRTDCINMIHLSESERARLIPAEWETEVTGKIRRSVSCRDQDVCE